MVGPNTTHLSCLTWWRRWYGAWWPVAVHVHRPERHPHLAHEGERRYASHAGREGGGLEGVAHPRVGVVGTGAALPLVALDGALEFGGTAQVGLFALVGVEILGISEEN